MEIGLVENARSSPIQRQSTFRDEADQAKHMISIQEIAEEMDIALEDVAACYGAILDDMRKEARIEDFLCIFVARRVRERLRARRN